MNSELRTLCYNSVIVKCSAFTSMNSVQHAALYSSLTPVQLKNKRRSTNEGGFFFKVVLPAGTP